MDSSGPPRVLIVEDEPVIASAEQRCLRGAGVPSIVVGRGREALEQINRDDFALVLLGHQLSDMTSRELIEALGDRLHSLPVVLVVGRGDERLAAEALEAGVADYIIRDTELEFSELLPQTVHRALERHRCRGSLRTTPVKPAENRHGGHRQPGVDFDRLAALPVSRRERKSAGSSAHLANRESQAQLQAILQASSDGILVIDERGLIEQVSSSAAAIFGYAESELLKRNVSILMPSPDRDRHDSYLAAAGSTSREYPRRVEGQRKDGTVFPLRLTVQAVPIEHRCLFVGIVRDLSQEVQQQKRMAQSERLAMLGEGLASLVHESRNVLARSHASLRMLARRVKEQPEVSGLVERTRAAQCDLERLFEAVRHASVPPRTERTPVSVGHLLHAAWDELAPAREGRDARIAEVFRATEPSCEVDAFSIRQVFRNILENALSFCGDPVEIAVAYSEITLNGEPAIQVAIRDNGPGLTGEHASRVFEAFYTTKTNGTGLGMAIARRIVEEHRGRLAVGQGSPGAELIVTLPRRQP